MSGDPLIEMRASGTATITVFAGDATSLRTLASTPKTGHKAPAWNMPCTMTTGAPGPLTSDAADVKVTAASEDKTILV